MFDSYRFLVVKNQIFILCEEEIFGWVECVFGATTSDLSSSSRSASLGCFQGSLVSDFPYLSLLMIDLVFNPMSMIIIHVSCCWTCGV